MLLTKGLNKIFLTIKMLSQTFFFQIIKFMMIHTNIEKMKSRFSIIFFSSKYLK